MSPSPLRRIAFTAFTPGVAALLLFLLPDPPLPYFDPLRHHGASFPSPVVSASGSTFELLAACPLVVSGL